MDLGEEFVGGLIQGVARSFQPSMSVSIAVVRSVTLVKVPRRMACRVMIEKKHSTRFSQEQLVGVKCRWIRGFLVSRAMTFGYLWVA